MDYCLRQYALESRSERTPDSPSVESAVRASENSVATNTARLRGHLGWTFEELAEQVNLEPSTCIRHVNRDISPSAKTLRRYADVFTQAVGADVSVADLQSDHFVIPTPQ